MSIPEFRALFGHHVAIDIGTSNTLMYVHNRGVVLNQPSVICFRRSGGYPVNTRIESIGEQAKALLGRVPQHLKAVQPIQQGVIADLSAAEQMIRRFIKMAHVRPWVGRRIEFTLCTHSAATPVERRAICEAVATVGRVKVHSIDVVLSAALGAGLPVSEAIGSMVVDIGGGSTGGAVIALGGVVHQTFIRVGGIQLDAAIIHHVRNLYGVQLGEHTAERVKRLVGTARRGEMNQSMYAVGYSTADGLPRTIKITSDLVADAIAEPLSQIVNSVKSLLEKTPPELVTDIADRGIMLTGGGALLSGLSQLLGDETGLVVRVADDPLTCAVRGAGQAAVYLKARGQLD